MTYEQSWDSGKRFLTLGVTERNCVCIVAFLASGFLSRRLVMSWFWRFGIHPVMGDGRYSRLCTDVLFSKRLCLRIDLGLKALNFIKLLFSLM